MAQKDHGDAPISAAQVDPPAVSHESESKLLTDSHEIPPMSQDTASQAQHDLLLREDHQAVSHSLTSGPSTLQSQVSQFQKPRIFLDICSGVTMPLSAALQKFDCDILPFDILIHSSCDLLNDSTFESLLRICASGMVGYCAASPACKEYSRLKLKPGGPPALRTPQQMQGRDDLSPDELKKVQESSIMLERCTICIRVTYQSGGHGHLEQPSTAMSWDEPFVQNMLLECHCVCISMPACSFNVDWAKCWLFASTFAELQVLGSKCSHPPGSHQPIAGVVDEKGLFLSRNTATYPPDLCDALATHISPLLSHGNNVYSLTSVELVLPIKGRTDLPNARNDGGGLTSHADWSQSNSAQDFLGTLRQNWVKFILEQHWHKRLVEHFAAGVDHPPFSEEELQPLKTFLDEFLTAQGIFADWSIPPDQPMHLHVLHALSKIIQDTDKSIFGYLVAGVPIGIHDTIERSFCFPEAITKEDDSPSLLSIHNCNWRSAEDEPDIVESLIDKEISEGWVEEFHGDISAAQDNWPKGIAVGKLGLALSDSRPPRLVLDNSICGVNGRCKMPEKATLPSALDVKRCYPLRDSSHRLSGFSLDIKSAHKRMAVQACDRGFLSFKFRNRHYFYKVCPFGAVFSAHYWARLGGFLLRLFHMLCFLSHAGFLFVDDFFMIQEECMMPVSATMICCLCLICKVPVSWKKCEIGPNLTWIGWKFRINIGLIILPDSKREKLLDLCHKLRHSDKCSRKTLEQFLGLAMWMTQLFRSMRTGLHVLYKDLYTLPASHYSINPEHWEQMLQCISDELVFQSSPPGTAIPLHAKLIQVRHTTITCKNDLRQCPLSDRRIWLRLIDPNTSKRKLSPTTQQVLRVFDSWLKTVCPFISMWPKPQWTGLCVADAFAAGDLAGIGGAVFFPSGQCRWFSLQLCYADFKALNIPMHEDLQKDISSLETLAQIALIFLVTRFQPGMRIPIKIPTLSDNSAAESVSNSLFTTSMPLALFVEKLSLLISSTGVDVDTSHIAGHDNDIADKLSRWSGAGAPPVLMIPSDRFSLSLQDLWIERSGPKLVPSDAWIPWQLPCR